MSPRQIRVFVGLVLALGLIGASCSDSGNSLSAGRGNVMISLTSDPSALAATTGTESSLPANGEQHRPGTATRDDDDDDEDDDRDRPGDGSDVTPRLTAVNLTFSSFLARNLDGELIDVAADLPRTINLFPIFLVSCSIDT